MRSHDPKLFAKVVILGQRIQMNSQAMLSLLSRITSGGKGKRDDTLKKQISIALKDLETCLKEFDLHTGIDMIAVLSKNVLLTEGFILLIAIGFMIFIFKSKKLFKNDDDILPKENQKELL